MSIIASEREDGAEEHFKCSLLVAIISAMWELRVPVWGERGVCLCVCSRGLFQEDEEVLATVENGGRADE